MQKTLRKISILVPSRGRPEEFAQMQESVRNVSRQVEILVALDEDDPELASYACESFTRKDIGERRFLTQRWNELARMAAGDYLMLGNDDMRFDGPEWVDMLCEINPSKPAVIGFKAGAWTDNHFIFPILTRAGYAVQGFFVPESVVGIYADTWLYQVGKKSGCIHYLPDYEITHLHWSTQSRLADATDKDRSVSRRAGDADIFKNTEKERNEISEKFRRY